MKKKEEKKISQKSILIGEKLVFKRRKIKTVGDLVKKNNKSELDKKKEKNTGDDYDDLSEEFFKKYFEKYNEYILSKQKEEEKERKKIDSKLKELEKQIEKEKKREEEEEDISIEDESFKNNNYQKENSLNNSKENQIKNIDSKKVKKKQTFDIDSDSDEIEEKGNQNDILRSLTSPLFNFNIDLKKKNKKTAKFQKYISSVIINYCQLETLENIGESLNLLLPDIKFEIPSNFKKIDLIQWLDLSNNKLSFINKDICTLINLKILNLNNNLFTDINKITNLSEMKNLISLSFIGNKIIKIPGYRQFVIEMCPILQQLDSAQVTEKELEIIHFGGSKFGEIRENGNGKVIKYPNPFENKKK